MTFRIVPTPGTTDVRVCRCGPHGFCLSIPENLDPGVGRAAGAALVTPTEHAEAVAHFMAMTPQLGQIPADCPRLAAVEVDQPAATA